MMDNQFILVDYSPGTIYNEEKDSARWQKFKDYLNKGYEIKRCYTTNNVFIFHIAELEPEEDVEEPIIESVIEIALDDNPLTVKEWTDDGWTVKNLYSKKAQLVKMKQIEDEE